MGLLDRFETSLDKLVNGAFAKAFKSEVQPVEIAAALQKEMDERAAIVTRERTVVPNEFTVALAPGDYERLHVYAEALTSELAGLAREYAAEQRYTFLGPVTVRLTESSDLETGLFDVTSQAIAGEPEAVPAAQAKVATAADELPPSRGAAPPGGRLLAAGQEIPLNTPVVVLGRGNEVDIRLEDPGVSRRHAEIHLGYPSEIVDLGSTNGTIVDGKRIKRARLADGSVIRLGSTDMTFRSP